ncbi:MULTISPECIES: hypothetical protein [unclassified Variovorax]|jgi:hypothetical protein|uniref:hypothetical protein n=1 Tax=unclassified Variovorax TaxID=663243 RepID=UPI0015FF81C9|nr:MULTISPECIES: hypothetical protein [unclassified Variovorax]MBB1602530.1 hypothetical protein [Variovorax sp. UMC13]MDM0086287.1 hypothetical protein [Variovorax sp. J22G40]MDM0145456.1 hypothetical protein [Variovorax sp. J2P1-31]
MTSGISSALAVKELELGEFHWILLHEEESADELLTYTPQRFSEPFSDPAAAWAAGYLVLRAMLRRKWP